MPITTDLKTDPSLQSIYFSIAIAEKEIASVRAYVETGADINEAILLLFSPAYKSDTLFWLHDNPLLLQSLTIDGMNSVIPEGKYQGKTVAETLVSTKKGRQLLMENEPLQTLLSQTTMADRLNGILEQAETERTTMSSPLGFFKKSNAKAVELVQLIVYGDLSKAEALLKDNPRLVETLLTEKVTVTDYSRRKVKKKTAFQAALCAMDDELCEMLAKYMSKEEMARQYQAIFPEGHYHHYLTQTSFDFTHIIQAICQSNNDDVKKALSLDLTNESQLWQALKQFRADFTKCSSEEEIFNPYHIVSALYLYEVQKFESADQKRLFWNQVVGYVQRYIPANIAMDYVQGIYNRAERNEKVLRSLKIGSRSLFFPLKFGSFSRLGYQYAYSIHSRGPQRNQPPQIQRSKDGASLPVIAEYFFGMKVIDFWRDSIIRFEPPSSMHLREQLVDAVSGFCVP